MVVEVLGAEEEEEQEAEGALEELAVVPAVEALVEPAVVLAVEALVEPTVVLVVEASEEPVVVLVDSVVPPMLTSLAMPNPPAVTNDPLDESLESVVSVMVITPPKYDAFTTPSPP